MRNLRRRIESLEKSRFATRDVRQSIVEKAMGWLGADEVELLIAAFGADWAGRRLTECEAAARQSYATALERECRCAGFHSTTGLELAADSSPASIGHAIILVLANRLSSEHLNLCSSGLRAAQTGDAPTEPESTAMQAYGAQMERVCQLAGFSSVAELSAFRCSPKQASDAIPRPRREVTRGRSSGSGRNGLRSQHELKPTREDERAAEAQPQRQEKNKRGNVRV